MSKIFSFKEKVFRVIKKIPQGKFLTYKEVVRLAGRPRAWRAVGNILNKNINPKIPCSRVIRSDGKVGGYKHGIKKKNYFTQKRRNNNRFLWQKYLPIYKVNKLLKISVGS